jgi:hypothetical protein
MTYDNRLVHSPATRAGLDRAMEHAEPHLRPVLQAVRDHQVGLLFIGQQSSPFRLPADRKRPAIIIIGDDLEQAVGPEQFHLPSIRRAVRASHSFAVISSAPPADLYQAMSTTAAVTRRNVMIVETRPEQEIQWVSLIQRLAPRQPICLSTVKGGHA